MKAITAYETNDGKQFFNKGLAERWQRETADIAWIVALGAPDGNGANYVQLPVGTKQKVFDACKASPYPHPRHADDSGSAWSQAWWVWQCIDEKNRLWGQPYYAFSPNPNAVALGGVR